MKVIDGGVCAAQGYTAAGMHCGVKSSNLKKKDVALVYSETMCAAAAVYTTNQVKAAPLHVTRAHLADGRAQAVIVNSGNANACAPNGELHAQEMCQAAGQALGISPRDVIVASTGVIGQELNIKIITDNVPTLAHQLRRAGAADAAEAIMTTDLVKKEAARELEIGGKTVRLGGMTKGSGMIHPNMGTMLCFLTTDAVISAETLKKLLLETVRISFNRISVDGDTSTNDMCCILANGLAGNPEILPDTPDYTAFAQALQDICITLARAMAADGEGAQHLITCTVQGAASEHSAEVIARSVISSTLTKAAIFGRDANWGRVLCAMGYSGESFDPEKVDVAFQSAAGQVAVCKNGRGLPFDEVLAKDVLSEKEVVIAIQMQEGDGTATCWGCDITYDYIRINGDYRT